MYRHPSNSQWLIAIVAEYVLLIVYAIVVARLARVRTGEQARSWKSRTTWLVLLSFLNPLPPLCAPIGLLLSWKSWRDGATVHS